LGLVSGHVLGHVSFRSGFRSSYKDFMLIQVYPVSSLSFDQCKQSDSPNGKITTPVLLLHEAK